MGDVHIQFLETQGAERGVCGDDDALALDVFDKLLLLEVRVMLNLERGRTNASMAQEVHDELNAEVANTNAAGEFLVDQRLHGLPCFLDSGIAECDFAVCVPAGRVANGRVNPFECDGEVNQIKVKVFETKVLELLAGNGLDFVAVVEGVPELGDDEQFFALDEAVFESAGDTLADFFFISVVYSSMIVSVIISIYAPGFSCTPQAPSKRR